MVASGSPAPATSPATFTVLVLRPRCQRRNCCEKGSRRASPYLYSPADVDALMAAIAAVRHAPSTRHLLDRDRACLAVISMRIGGGEACFDRHDVNWAKVLTVVSGQEVWPLREDPCIPALSRPWRVYAPNRDKP